MDSSLSSFLPLIGTVFGAIAGGFVGAWASNWYRNKEASKAEKRELSSLLALLSIEVESHRGWLKVVWQVEEGPPKAALQSFRTDVWDKAQVRLAELMSTKEFKRLAIYYQLIAAFPNTHTAQQKSREDISESGWEHIEYLIALSTVIVETFDEQDPEQVQDTYTSEAASYLNS